MSNDHPSISPARRFAILSRDGFKCVYCGVGSNVAVLVVDHRDPWVESRDHSDKNLATSCIPCNSGKTDRIYDNLPVVSDLPPVNRNPRRRRAARRQPNRSIEYEKRDNEAYRLERLAEYRTRVEQARAIMHGSGEVKDRLIRVIRHMVVASTAALRDICNGVISVDEMHNQLGPLDDSGEVHWSTGGGSDSWEAFLERPSVIEAQRWRQYNDVVKLISANQTLATAFAILHTLNPAWPQIYPRESNGYPSPLISKELHTVETILLEQGWVKYMDNPPFWETAHGRKWRHRSFMPPPGRLYYCDVIPFQIKVVATL